MRILIHAFDDAAASGGSFTFQYELLQAVQASQSSHEFFMLPSKSWDEHTVRIPKLPVKTPLAFKAWRSLLWRVGIRKPTYPNYWIHQQLLENQIDLIWSMVPSGIPDPRTPYFFTIWDMARFSHHEFPELGSAAERKKGQAPLKKLAQESAGIFTGTRQGQNEIVQHLNVPAEKIHILGLPTPGDFLKPQKENSSLEEFKIKTPYIFYPAQFWAHKNHAVLLEALKELDVQLVFTGSDKGNLKEIQALVQKYNLADHVTHLGFVSHSQLRALYQNALALVFPSFLGPDNIPPVEAMACGTPAVVADVPGVREQLGDAALYFDPRDAKAFAQNILKLQQDSGLRKSLIEKGLQRAKSWDATAYVKGAFENFDRYQKSRQITLGICTLGRVESLEKLLSSVRNFKLPYDEIIVSDENFSAETESKLKAIIPSLIYVAGPRRGLCANRNTVLKHFKGDWIHLIDDDCEFENDGVSVFKQSNPNPQMIYSGWEVKNGQKVFANDTNYLGFQSKPYQAGQMRRTVVINATFFPRAVFNQIQFDEKIRYGSDEVDIVLRAFKAGFKVQPLEKFYVLHHHVDQFREGYRLQADISRVYVGFKQRLGIFTWPAAILFLLIACSHLFKTYLTKPFDFLKIMAGVFSKIGTP